MATNENIVTERTTEGAKPAMIPKMNKETRMISNFRNEPLLVLGIGFRMNVTKTKINPICNPDTDKYVRLRHIDNPL